MKMLVFSGSALRHICFANSIIENFNVVGLVNHYRDYNREKNVAGDIRLEYSREDTQLMDWHFSLREEKEREYFSAYTCFYAKEGMERLDIQPQELNTEKTIQFVKKCSPDVVIVYGTGLFKK